MIQGVVEATRETGAIRHGAECFNYIFPQELDEAYLVVWHGFEDKAWEYLDEDELRDFLIERAAEGWLFPLNPIWVIRDEEWWSVYEALLKTEAGAKYIQHYFGLCDGVDQSKRLADIHKTYEDGFLPNGTGIGGASRQSLALDMEAGERMGLAMAKFSHVKYDGDSDDDGNDEAPDEIVRKSLALGEMEPVKTEHEAYFEEIKPEQPTSKSFGDNSEFHKDLLSENSGLEERGKEKRKRTCRFGADEDKQMDAVASTSSLRRGTTHALNDVDMFPGTSP